MVPLYYSSFLLALPAYYGEGSLIGRLFLLLFGLSVLNHAKKTEDYPGKGLVEALDRSVGHALAVIMARRAIQLPTRDVMLFWSCLAYVIYNYHIARPRMVILGRTPDAIARMHLSFHVASVIGSLSLLHAIYAESKKM